jgi:hypothetical protein
MKLEVGDYQNGNGKSRKLMIRIVENIVIMRRNK